MVRVLAALVFLSQAWAVLESRRGDSEKATELFGRAVEADPCHAAAYQAWAMHAERCGDYHTAAERFKRSAALDHGPALQARKTD